MRQTAPVNRHHTFDPELVVSTFSRHANSLCSAEAGVLLLWAEVMSRAMARMRADVTSRRGRMCKLKRKKARTLYPSRALATLTPPWRRWWESLKKRNVPAHTLRLLVQSVAMLVSFRVILAASGLHQPSSSRSASKVRLSLACFAEVSYQSLFTLRRILSSSPPFISLCKRFCARHSIAIAIEATIRSRDATAQPAPIGAIQILIAFLSLLFVRADGVRTVL